jgi:putative DNA-invertase from lambdoid prophage Rac
MQKNKHFSRHKAANGAGTGVCYGYARVSTLAQADEGQSLEVQQRILAGYAQMQTPPLTIAKVYVERGVSGSKPLGDRPQGAALLGILQPGDVVLTTRLDRMFRSALDALEVLGRLKKAGISLHMIDLGGDVTGNGVSKLMFTILSAVAEAERDRTRERITEVKQDQRKRGRYLGGTPPFGMLIGPDGALVPAPGTENAVRRMQLMRRQGKSLRAIAESFTRRGVTISHMGVKKTLLAASDRAG